MINLKEARKLTKQAKQLKYLKLIDILNNIEIQAKVGNSSYTTELPDLSDTAIQFIIDKLAELDFYTMTNKKVSIYTLFNVTELYISWKDPDDKLDPITLY